MPLKRVRPMDSGGAPSRSGGAISPQQLPLNLLCLNLGPADLSALQSSLSAAANDEDLPLLAVPEDDLSDSGTVARSSTNSRCQQCHRRHNPALRCRCYACGTVHHTGDPCAMVGVPEQQCPICHQHHPAGPCIAGLGPIAVPCMQCGRSHLPARRCKCRTCGHIHSASSACGIVRAPSIHGVYAGAALNRDIVPAYDGGAPSQCCPHCSAIFFVGEAQYLNCCRNGAIVVMQPDVPAELISLITDSHVHLNIRKYNAALSMASIGYTGNSMSRNSAPAPHRPHVDGWGSLKISGRVYHRIGSLVPANGCAPSWGQLFMLDAAEATNLRMTNTDCAGSLRPTVLAALHRALQQHNPWVAEFAAAGTSAAAELTWSSEDVSTRSGIISVQAAVGCRSVVVRRHSNALLRISDQHPLYFPLAYVLLWPSGGVGYSDQLSRRDPVSGAVGDKIHMLEWAKYIIMHRSDNSLIHLCGKLCLEFFCDVWSAIEGRNLDYLGSGAIQSQFRSTRYYALQDQLRSDGDRSLWREGVPVHLPASFAGSPRWYHALYLDALALPAAFHLPDLFVTITFNPEWPELSRLMPAGGNIHDHPDVAARVFWLRFSRIMKDIIDHAVFGEVLSYCYRMEWQLRGFPHAHVLLILRRRILCADDVDRIVSAEIPDPEQCPELHQVVTQFMIHGPCAGTNAPCVVEGVCEKNFPKMLQPHTVMMGNAYPLYRRRGLFTGQVRGATVTDEWVVPHNLYLLLRHRSHICVEVASHLILYKYVYKYCFKPPDNGAICFNEIAAYVAGRILSSAEAVWRILQLPLHKEFPSVQRLTVHLPDHQLVMFDAMAGDAAAHAAAEATTSTLLQWFALNIRDPDARTLLYKDVPQHYKWDQSHKVWQRRRYKGCKKVARMHGVSSHNVELFMLRRLLLVVPGAQRWEDLRTFDGCTYPSFESAARARGMLNDDTEMLAAFHEVLQHIVCVSTIRRQFVMFLVFCRPARPVDFFEHFRQHLFPPESAITDGWHDLMLCAAEFRTKLETYGIIPPVTSGSALPLLAAFDPMQCSREADELWLRLNVEQQQAAAAFLAAVDAPRGDSPRVFMLQASGGSGKSFVANYIAARIRSRNVAAICVAASAQAAALLTGGRTAHGQLRIPIDCDAASYLDLKVNEKHEICAAGALLWDEASMVSDHVADCVNKSFQDILQCPLPFGGMPVLFLGDWRQLLPVVRRSSGEHHTIQKCIWWQSVTILKLLHNWRCQQPAWLQLLDDVGMGRIDEVRVAAVSVRSTLDDVIEHVWADAASCATAQKAIVTLTLEDAAEVNDKIIRAIPGECITALCNDTYMDCKEPDLYPEDFVRSLNISGVPPGTLQLKVGARYIIIRNIDYANGIVNGAQVLCTSVTTRHFIGATPHCTAHNHCHCQPRLFTMAAGTILYGPHAGTRVMLPRMTFIITTSQSHLPFSIMRRQYALIPGYAYTVHRSQGSTLDLLGIYFNGAPFCHGLLYTALSRVRGEWRSITVHVPTDSAPALHNCVRQHVLQCLLT